MSEHHQLSRVQGGSEPGECSKEDNTLASMIRRKKGKRQAGRQAETAGGDGGEGTDDARGSGSTGLGRGREDRGVGLIGNTRQRVIQVKRKENPISWCQEGNKRVAGGDDLEQTREGGGGAAAEDGRLVGEEEGLGGCWELAATMNSETTRGLALGLAKDF